jgi:transposase
VISLAPGTKVFLACRPVDLRNGFDGLAAKAQQIIGENPFICIGWNYVAASRHSA